jgi:hypothetical protein
MAKERVLITVKTYPTLSRKYGECGQLFWNCLRRHGDEAVALEKVKTKYLDEFGKRDLYFFLGTTQQFHGFAPNPWVIVGVFAPPHQHQLDLAIPG